MEDGRILYSFVEDTCIIKMTGAMVYKSCQDFSRFLDKLRHNTTIKKFVIDLTETTYINSTNLGLLSKLYEISRKKSGARPIIISTESNINEILLDIGFSNIFDIIHDTDMLEPNYRKIPKAEDTENEIGKIMLESHKNLAKLNIKNEEQFKDVIKFLEEDLNKNEQ